MRKIKAAVLIDAWFPFRGGGQIHVHNLNKQLKPYCEFKIYHSRSSSLISRFFWSYNVIQKVQADHSQNPYDLIHAHAYLSGIPASILGKKLKIPVVFTVHGSNTLDLNELRKTKKQIRVSRIKYEFEKKLLTGIKYNHQISVASNFLEYKNINRKITVIPNGVDIKKFNQVRGAKAAEFTILYVSRSDYVKGEIYLNQALNILKDRKIIPKVIKVKGGVDDEKRLIKLYKSAWLYVSSSLSEGQPLTLLEAWAAKLPVVVTCVGENPRMVTEGINGYLATPADAVSLAQKIEKAYRNRNLASLGESGYNLVKRNYTWKIAAQKTLAVYKEVINAA